MIGRPASEDSMEGVKLGSLRGGTSRGTCTPFLAVKGTAWMISS
jgi:hypothetical protein